MRSEPTPLPGVIQIFPDVFEDSRGYFLETWQQGRFGEIGIQEHFLQDNESCSGQFALRGLHYQVVRPQGKLVRVVLGEVFDVAVDLRRSSSHFGRSFGVRLSSENKRQLWIPPGLAHGFLVLSKQAVFAYKCTQYYVPQLERTLLWNDPDLRIQWPIPEGIAPVLSARDSAGLPLRTAEVFP